MRFVKSISDLTTKNRYVLLVFDEYAVHMLINAVEMFRRNQVVVYVLPLRTSGKTQPLDLLAFNEFEHELDSTISSMLGSSESAQLNMFHYCSLMKHVYFNSFTRQNTLSSFRRAGM